MSRWRAVGYPSSAIFPGVWACRFRLCHKRDDGRFFIMSVGDQRNRHGHLGPVADGKYFVSFVAVIAKDEEPEVIERHASNDFVSAHAMHETLLEAWEHTE